MKARNIYMILTAVFISCMLHINAKAIELEKQYQAPEVTPIPLPVLEVVATPDPAPYLRNNVPLGDGTLEYIYEQCMYYGVDYNLVLAVMHTETRFNLHQGTNSSNCTGIMQLNLTYWEFYSPVEGVVNAESLLDPYINIRAGIYQLSVLQAKYGTLEEILLCYNNGEYGAKISYFDKGLYTSRYTEITMQVYKELKSNSYVYR